MIRAKHPVDAGVDARAFTLLEILLATAIFSIVIVAINTVFFAALHWRRSVTASIEASMPVNNALQIMRKDLLNTVSPGGIMAGTFRYGGSGMSFGAAQGAPASSGTATSTRSSSGANATLNLNQAVQGGLDFFTSTGVLRDEAPGSDIQEINYQLLEALEGNEALGRDLVRSVTRNLLSFSHPVAEQHRILRNVESLEFEFYDGNQWRDSWDTSATDTSLPRAVRVRLLQALERTNDFSKREPIEMIVLLNNKGASSGTNDVSATGQ